jgi:RNA polymerase sigma factor (sigma-70 family)
MKINLSNRLKDGDQERLFQELKLDPGNKEIRNALVEHNLKLVRWMAEKYHKYLSDKFEMDDLFQQGVIGLITAIEKYDPEEGSFSPYAYYWIKQSIIRNLDDNGNLIRVPSHYNQLIRDYKKTVEDLTNALEGKPTVEEIAQVMKLETKKVEEIQIVSREVLSLDMPVETEGDEGITIADTVEDESASFESRLVSKLFIEQFIKHFQPPELTELEFRIIVLTYGLTVEPVELKTISELYDIDYATARSMHTKALWKIRRSSFIRELRSRVERRVDTLTPFYKTKEYGNLSRSRGTRYSPVENLAIQREEIRERIIKEMKKK